MRRTTKEFTMKKTTEPQDTTKKLTLNKETVHSRKVRTNLKAGATKVTGDPYCCLYTA